ncbi:DVU3141 family protein [Salinicola aestuarinus]|uniref:DVU3141 family protein n=1 Tax=Salinicola aestuarinus TaxID=1949082 RepID=UPI0013001E31|nr:DVU3141 family protein [Salinicola aestuarinus]
MKTIDAIHTPSRRWFHLASIALMALILSGCAANAHRANSADSVPMDDATPANAQLAAFLDGAAPGSTVTLTTSPWGDNVAVYARDRYFAASGRQCIHLELTRTTAPASLNDGRLACRVSGKGWYTQRLVTALIR